MRAAFKELHEKPRYRVAPTLDHIIASVSVMAEISSEASGDAGETGWHVADLGLVRGGGVAGGWGEEVESERDG